jgi:hypothetical protein
LSIRARWATTLFARPAAGVSYQRGGKQMKRNTVLVAGVFAVLALLYSVPSHAVTFSPTTQVNRLTFSQPVLLPGVILPAGTYSFELAPAGTHTDIVRVSSLRGQPFYLGFTRPVPRPRTLAKNQVVEFGERVAGAPAPIAVWYPVNGPSGHAFVYP